MPLTDSIPWLAALAGGLVVLSLGGKRLLAHLGAARSGAMRPTAAPSPIEDRLAAIELSLGEVSRQLDRIEKRLASARPKPAPPQAPPQRLEPEGDPVVRQIYQLADEGMGSLEIARKLNQHRGKVELILALRQE